jgi:transcriptional regulator with XRE-family HTH domain
MTGDEIKALRRALDLTARKLGAALGVDQATVLAWEREELFPTKRHVEAMRALLERGGEGANGARTDDEKEAGPTSPWRALADPGMWRLIRKIMAYPRLRGEVAELAAKYVDPAED